MLWYKGWLETRYRLLFCIGWTILFMALLHPTRPVPLTPGAKGPVFGIIMFSCPTIVLMACAMLGGSGVVTQPSLQASKGLHGSTLYTLSLPVSRLRLLTVRASIGWMEMAGVVMALCASLWMLAPAFRSVATPLETVEYAVTLIACGSAMYGVSVLLATFLDDQWRAWGTMGICAFMWWLCTHVPLPRVANIFSAMREGSPVVAHSVPWAAMGFSTALGAALLLAAARIVQRREY